MKTEDINNNVYIELDTIVDTRLGFLYNIDKDMLKELIDSNMYHNRVKDEFKYISSHVFHRLYLTRDKSVLKHALPTNILHLLKEYKIEAMYTNTIYEKETTKVFLNVYPYKLFDKEIETLKLGMSTLLNNQIEVEVVYMTPDDLSPSWVDKNVGLMIMYSGINWIDREVSSGRLVKLPLPDVGLITPNLVTGDITVENNKINGFFEDIVKNISPFIKVLFLKGTDFSMLNKK